MTGTILSSPSLYFVIWQKLLAAHFGKKQVLMSVFSDLNANWLLNFLSNNESKYSRLVACTINSVSLSFKAHSKLYFDFIRDFSLQSWLPFWGVWRHVNHYVLTLIFLGGLETLFIIGEQKYKNKYFEILCYWYLIFISKSWIIPK